MRVGEQRQSLIRQFHNLWTSTCTCSNVGTSADVVPLIVGSGNYTLLGTKGLARLLFFFPRLPLLQDRKEIEAKIWPATNRRWIFFEVRGEKGSQYPKAKSRILVKNSFLILINPYVFLSSRLFMMYKFL